MPFSNSVQTSITYDNVVGQGRGGDTRLYSGKHFQATGQPAQHPRSSSKDTAGELGAVGGALHIQSKVNPQDFVHPYLVLQVLLQAAPANTAFGKTQLLSVKNATTSSHARPSLSPSGEKEAAPALPSPILPSSQKAGNDLVAHYFHASLNNPTATTSQQALLQAPADFINIEITFRDKQNQKKRIVFSNNPSSAGGLTARTGNERSAGAIERVIPITGVIQPGKWTNLCIDLGTLSAHLFSNASAKDRQNTDGSNNRAMARSRGESNPGDSRGAAQRGTGNASATGRLFSTQTAQQQLGQTNKSSTLAAAAQGSPSPYGNANTTKRVQNFRHLEQIQLEGQFKLRKVFTVRNKLLPDVEYQGVPLPPAMQASHHASTSSVVEADSQLQPKLRASQHAQEQPREIYSSARPQDNAELFSAAPDSVVDDYTQAVQAEDEIAQQQKPKGKRAGLAPYENHQGNAGRGQAPAAKSGGYHEPVPAKMDFPQGVKHQNQLIDFRTVLRIQETMNAIQATSSARGDGGAGDDKSTERNPFQNQRAGENTRLQRQHSRNNSRDGSSVRELGDVVRRDRQTESRQSKGSTRVSVGGQVASDAAKRISYKQRANDRQSHQSHVQKQSEANEMVSVSSGATGVGATSGSKAMVKQRSFVQKLGSRRGSNKGKDNLFTGGTDSEFEDDAYNTNLNPSGVAGSGAQAGQAPKKVSTGGQRKNKFHEIPKAAHHAHQTQSAHHGPTSSKKQYSNSAQRIFSPKSQNQLFKVSNIHKSRHQEDAQPPKHSSAQNFKRKAAESQDLRSQLQADDQQDGAKSRQQAYSSLSRNSGPNGPSTAMASASKLHGLTLSQKANQPASPPTFLTGMSSNFAAASVGFGMGSTLNNMTGGNTMSNLQNIPTTYSLQEVKEHSIQEENDQMSIAVREASEAEELEMITEVVNETKKRHKDHLKQRQIQRKQQNIAKIYQQQRVAGGQHPKEKYAIEPRQLQLHGDFDEVANAGAALGPSKNGRHGNANELLREEKNRSTAQAGAGVYGNVGKHHNQGGLGAGQGGAALLQGGKHASGAAGKNAGTRSTTKNQAAAEGKNYHGSKAQKLAMKEGQNADNKRAAYQQRRQQSNKEYGFDGGAGARAGALGRSSKGQAQSGDDKSQSQLEESLGAVVGSSIKKSALGQQKGQASSSQGTSSVVSKVQERINRAQRNRQLAQQHGKQANKSPDVMQPQNRPSLVQRNDSHAKLAKIESSTSKQANNPQANYSATKSQANITNNNFAKFSSSGYTNNNFLLASGHHDFIPNDFQIMSNGKQTGGNWNLDASQIEKNLKSTAKSKQGFLPNNNLSGTLGSGAQNQNYMLNLSQEEGGPYAAQPGSGFIDVRNHEDKGLANIASDEIEESIIEEDIEMGAGQTVQSPASPLINSRTKGKGKLDLFMMRPPRAEGSRHNSNDLTGNMGGPSFHLPPGQGAPRVPPFIFNRGGGHAHLQLAPATAAGKQTWSKGEPSVIDEETSSIRQKGRHEGVGLPRQGSDEDVYDPSVLLGQLGSGSHPLGEQQDDTYDVMYDILVEPDRVSNGNAKGSAYYQRTASQDRLDLMDNINIDRTEVPSINGGLPITMQVKKEPSFVHGGAFSGTSSNIHHQLSAGTSSTALSQLKQRRPFSPPLKQNFQDKSHKATPSLGKKVQIQDTKMDQDDVPPNTVIEEII